MQIIYISLCVGCIFFELYGFNDWFKLYDFMYSSLRELLLTFSLRDLSHSSGWFILLKKNFLLHNFELIWLKINFSSAGKKTSDGSLSNVEHNPAKLEGSEEPVPKTIYTENTSLDVSH